MIEPRTIKCQGCAARNQETKYGEGFPGWMGMDVNFIGRDGAEERAHLCPSCKTTVLNCVEKMRKEHGLD